MQLNVWILCFILALNACQQQEEDDVKESRLLLGTVVEFTVSGVDEKLALSAIKQAVYAIQDVEKTFTTHGNVFNTVQTFNHAKAGEEVELAAEVSDLLGVSIDLHDKTYGAFDPSLGSLNQLWGFSGREAPIKPPSVQDISKQLARSGVQHIRQVRPHVWVKDMDGLALDFGAIAKGLAIDKGMKALQDEGVSHAIVNAGGDLRVLGDHRGKPWRIAIRSPRKDEVLGWFDIIKDISVVTSGDYERFFLFDGKRYHHILDPKTGMPSSNSMSVTVQAKTAQQADALSTALFVLGYEKGMSVIENLDNTEAIWVDEFQKIHVSSGLKHMFKTKKVTP